MSKKIGFSNKWPQYVAKNRRPSLLTILEEISRRYQTQKLPFILIGACSLLIRGCLKYKAWWDIDLLFESQASLLNFHANLNSTSIKIFSMDQNLVDYGHLSSLQTMWGVDGIWYRVDYIYKDRYYDFHAAPEDDIIYKTQIKLADKSYQFNLPIAHPWNILIEKLLSPRLKFELDVEDTYSIDIRHIFTLFSLYHEEETFWSYLSAKTTEIKNKNQFKENFRRLLHQKDTLGYTSLTLTENDMLALETL